MFCVMGGLAHWKCVMKDCCGVAGKCLKLRCATKPLYLVCQTYFMILAGSGCSVEGTFPYALQPMDTLSKVATTCDTSVDAIVQSTTPRVQNQDQVQAGQQVPTRCSGSHKERVLF